MIDRIPQLVIDPSVRVRHAFDGNEDEILEAHVDSFLDGSGIICSARG